MKTPPVKDKGSVQPPGKIYSRDLAVNSFLQTVLPRLIIVSTLMRGLNPAGRLVWEQYRQLCSTFSDHQQRLQFISAGPEMYYEINHLDQVPESVISKFGLSKQDFLDFVGFAALCNLEDRHCKILELEQLLKQGAIPEEIAEAYQKTKTQLEEEIAAPVIPNAVQFNACAETFRSLLQEFFSPNIFLTFDYPHFIWITQNRLAARFVPDHPKFGKWIINSRDPRELIVLAKKLLPHCAAQDLGTIKFEFSPRNNGICFIAIFCHENDPAVELLVRTNAGKAPFWCYDEYCYDADALITFLRHYLVRKTEKMFSCKSSPPSQAEKLLERGAEIGLSPFQTEILYTLIDPERTARVKPDTALEHILSTYFINAFDALKDLVGMETLHTYVKMFICVLFEPENLGAAQAFFVKHKQEVLAVYSRKV